MGARVLRLGAGDRAATAFSLGLGHDLIAPHDADVDALIARKAAGAAGQCRRLEIAGLARRLGVYDFCWWVCSVAVYAGVAVAASDHTAVDGALHDIDVHLIAVALHELTSLVLLDGFAAAAIQILRDAAPVVVFAPTVFQHQFNDDGWNAALLLPELSVVGDVHLQASFQLVVSNL